MDELDQEWAKTHIKRVENSLIVFDNNGTEVATIAIKTKEDDAFVHGFFGI
jgi:hypothetical protein